MGNNILIQQKKTQSSSEQIGKMAEKTKTTIAASLIIALLASLGVTQIDLSNSDLYYCESDYNVRTCPEGISAGLQTRCYEEKGGWDYCSTGWKFVENDINITEAETETEVNISRDTWKCYVNGTCISKQKTIYSNAVEN